MTCKNRDDFVKQVIIMKSFAELFHAVRRATACRLPLDQSMRWEEKAWNAAWVVAGKLKPKICYQR